MRTVQTFILRLLVDPAEPGPVRGAVERVSEGKSYPFVGEEQLLTLLRRAAQATGGTPAGPEPADSGQGERLGDC